MDAEAFRKDLDELYRSLKDATGAEDYRHLRKMERWGRTCSALGYATAWIAPNPVSVALLSTGTFARWTIVAHHVLHKAYDRIPGVPRRHTSTGFARGWRRVIDWLDWIHPAAWEYEHNRLHHYRLGENHDPDQPERNLEYLRQSTLPKSVRYALIGVISMNWKWVYYAPNTIQELRVKRSGQEPDPDRVWRGELGNWLPIAAAGRELWWRSWLPYAVGRFVVAPAPFALLGPWAYASALCNLVMAEAMTNAHSFFVIVSNHAAADLYRFDGKAQSKAEFYLRQVRGSTNFTTGGDLRDFLHGWLNYQVEHHLWPNLTLRQYQRAQPQVKAICEKHGVPYLQESMWRRASKMLKVLTGARTMKRWPEGASETTDAAR